MRKCLFVVLLGGLLLLPAATVEGHGCRSHGCAPACAPACETPCNVTWVEQERTGWRCETRTRVVPTQVTRMVAETVSENVKRVEMVQVVTPKTYTQTYCTYVTKQVPYTCTVNVPVWTPKTITETVWKCVPEKVTIQVPVCTMVPCQVTDACTGCCYTSCKPVTVLQPRETVVWKRVPETREVTINVCSWRAEERQGVRTVCEMVPQTREVTVNVVTCQPVEKWVTVNRVVCRPVTETVNVTQCYTEMVPYKYTVKVAVPCAAPCAPACGH